MQERKALRKTLKKIAAVGTGALMLGMTLTGALAADLSTIPTTFGGSDAMVIYGANGAPSDQEVANSLLTGLGLEKPATTTTTTTTTTTGEKLEFDSGKLKDIPVGTGLNDSTYGFPGALTDNDINGLLDTSMSIDIGAVSDKYNFHEEIRIGGDAKTAVETGLTFRESQGKDWKDNVFIPLKKESIGYFFVFDKALKTGNYIANSTTSEPIYLDMLGKTLEVQCGATGCDTDTIIVLAGQKYRLKAGESASVGGKIVTFKGASTTSASVDVDGVGAVITANQQQNVNGLKVRVQDLFNEEGIVDDTVTLVVGKDAQKTYNDGDEYIGEPENDPMWIWQLSGLTGANPDIGVWFGLNVNTYKEKDNPAIEHPLYTGDYVCLPNNYACVIFESMKHSDDESMTVEIGIATEDLYTNDADTDADVSDGTGIYFKAIGTNDEGLQVGTTDTEEVFFYTNLTSKGAPKGSAYHVYRKSTENSHFIWTSTATMTTDNFALFKIKWKSSIIDVGYEGASGRNPFNITINAGRHGTSNSSVLKIYFENTTDGSVQNFLGHSDGDTTKGNDLVWLNQSTTTAAQGVNTGTMTDISGWQEDTREKYGIVIENPNANGPSDIVKLRIPSDTTEFRANVRVARPKGAASAATTTTTGVAMASKFLKKDIEVTDLTAYNAVVVGGPCINKHAAALLGIADGGKGTDEGCGEASTFKAGEAYLRLSSQTTGKYALLVAGWSADDTKRAGVVATNSGSFTLAGKESATVTGTGLEVTGITVA